MTVHTVSYYIKMKGGGNWLTVKFVDVVDDGLDSSPTTWASTEYTFVLGFLLVDLEYYCQWNEDRWRDDSEYAIAPAPAGRVQEGLGGQRPSKCSADEWGAGKGEGESSIAKTSCIGNKDIQDQIESVISNPV